MREHKDYKPAAKLNPSQGYTWDDILGLDAESEESSELLIKDLYSLADDVIAGLRKTVEGPEGSQIMRRHTDLLGLLTSSRQ